jgi:hypothetical protein
VVVICHPGLLFDVVTPTVAAYKARLRANDVADVELNSPQPCFVHFDSLRSHCTKSICDVLKKYVVAAEACPCCFSDEEADGNPESPSISPLPFPSPTPRPSTPYVIHWQVLAVGVS